MVLCLFFEEINGQRACDVCVCEMCVLRPLELLHAAGHNRAFCGSPCILESHLNKPELLDNEQLLLVSRAATLSKFQTPLKNKQKEKLHQRPPKGGQKTCAARKLSRNVDKHFGHFLTMFEVFLPCAKKRVEKYS